MTKAAVTAASGKMMMAMVSVKVPNTFMSKLSGTAIHAANAVIIIAAFFLPILNLDISDSTGTSSITIEEVRAANSAQRKKSMPKI